MAKCKDCIHFPICEPHTAPEESYPEVGGCPAFKAKDAFTEVVRCKDCKSYENRECKNLVRHMTNPCSIYTLPNDFCSYGKRRTDGTT